MKQILVLAFVFVYFAASGQKQFAPKLEWSKCYSDTTAEDIHALLVTSDSSIIYNEVKGYCISSSNLVKINKKGDIVWRSYVQNKGWINTMFEYTPNLFFIFYQPYLSQVDVTVIEGYDSTGAMSFNKTIYGFQPISAIKAKNGDIIISGVRDIQSVNSSIVITRLDINGNIKWQKFFGGSKMDIGNNLMEQNENNILVMARALSNDGDMIGKHGNLYEDVALISLDSLGNKNWLKCFGGSKTEYPIDLLPYNKNSFYMLINTSSYDGDIKGNHGDSSIFYGSGTNEIWMSLIDINGNIIRSKCFGNDSVDISWSVTKTYDKNGILVYGSSDQRTNSGDLYGMFSDTIKSYVWVARFDSLFNLQWFKSVGGTSGISYYKHIGLKFGNLNKEGCFMGSGRVTSNGEDINDFHESVSVNCLGNKPSDVWFFKLEKDTLFSYPTIQGYIYTDHNKNNVKDSLEPYKVNCKVQLSNGNYTFTDNNGFYQIQADSSGIYNLTVALPTGYNAVPQSFNYNFTTLDTTINQNIALQPAIVFDSISVQCLPMYMQAIQNGKMAYYTSYENAGTTLISPTIKVDNHKSFLIYDSCTDSNSTFTINGGLITGTNNMQPGQQEYLIGYFSINPSAQVGDTLTTTYSAATTTINFTDSFNMIVEAPNPTKHIATKKLTTTQVGNGKEIIYNISFQNKTPDTAFNIVITDSLNSLLQHNTIRMIASSHKCKATVRGNIVTFQLLNINVPNYAADKVKSIGFVSFAVKPKLNVTAGMEINNQANIFINYRLPIVTTSKTLIVNSLLPLKLLSFTAKQQQNKVLLNWQTATEENVSHINIQRSINGKEFTTIGTQKANCCEYSFHDSPPLEELGVGLYYRLEIVDKDGSKTYSSIQKITINTKSSTLRVYPNPSQGNITIEAKDMNTIEIIDYLGRKIKQQAIQTQATVLNYQLPKGIYFIKATMKAGAFKTEKIVVE